MTQKHGASVEERTTCRQVSHQDCRKQFGKYHWECSKKRLTFRNNSLQVVTEKLEAALDSS